MAEIFHISASNASDNNSVIQKAVSLLLKGGILVMPSDTIYGIFAGFTDSGIEKLHSIKQRPVEKPFLLTLPESFHLNDIINMECVNSDMLDKISILWPGKNTLILPKLPNISYPQGDTIAIRVPSKHDNEFFFEVLNQYNSALLAPSLNLHGQKPLELLDQMILIFGDKVDAIFFDESFIPGEASQLWDLTVAPFRKLR